MIFRFKKFPVYIASIQFRRELKKLINEKFPAEEKYILSSQLRRALDSIILNIAEGSERLSDLDFSRFLNTALTSVNEISAGLDLAKDDGYISDGEYENLNKSLENIYCQLKAFASKVRHDNNKN